MTQVQVLTIDHRELISLNNRKAEAKEHPPKGSPYKLTKEQREIVDYVKGSCFQMVVDKITGERYKTRQWLDNWLQLSLTSLGTVVDKELSPYLSNIIQLDGVTDVYGYLRDGYENPYIGSVSRYASVVKHFRKYVKYANVEVRKGKPIMYETRDGWRFDPNESEKIELVAVRTVTEMITAIASHSTQVEKVTT